MHACLTLAQRGLLAAQCRLSAGQFRLLAGQALHVTGAAGLRGLAAGFLHCTTCLSGGLTCSLTCNGHIAGRTTRRLRCFCGGLTVDVVGGHRAARYLSGGQRKAA